MRHLGATATLLAVVPESRNAPALRAPVERFLKKGARTLALLDVPAQTTIRVGAVHEEIQRELNERAYDLLVLGMPLPNHEGRRTLTGMVGQFARSAADRPLLLVRSFRHAPLHIRF